MVLGVISVFLLIAAVYTLSREPAYTAEARLAVESRNDGISGLETEGFAGSAYVEVASDDALVDEAASRSGWSAGSDEFREALDIGYFDRSGGSSGVEVGFTAAEPQMAIQAVNAYTELLAERIPATEPEGAVGTVNEVRLENRAVTASTSGGYRPVFNLLSAGLIGCVVGGGAAFLLDTRTRSWRNARDAEITLHAPVLGTIPDYEAFGTETTDGNGKKPG